MRQGACQPSHRDWFSHLIDLTAHYGYTGSMKATIDVPDALYRRVKARAALEGRAVREVTIALYQGWLGEPAATGSEAPLSAEEWLAGWEEIGREIQRKSIDPRPMSEIIISERR